MSTLRLQLVMPNPPPIHDAAGVAAFWDQVATNARRDVISQIRRGLNKLATAGQIKSFNVQKSNHCFQIPKVLGVTANSADAPVRRFDELGLWDLAKPGVVNLACIALEAILPRYAPTTGSSPKDSHRTSAEALVIINAPWKATLECSWLREFKSHYKLGATLHVGFCLPIVDPVHIPGPDECRHDFRHQETSHYEWRLLWECKHCGHLCYCACFRKAMTAEPLDQHAVRLYTRQLGRSPLQIPYHDGACELCRGVTPKDFYCHPMYARSALEARYGAYIRKRMAEMRTEGRQVPDFPLLDAEASNDIRQIAGRHKIGEKWIRETRLFEIVKKLLPGFEVIHHYRAVWLNKLELDVFVPALRLALEYHGPQHFKAIQAWGGQAALEVTQWRDSLKARLCVENGVKLMVFRSEDPLNAEAILRRLRKEF